MKTEIIAITDRSGSMQTIADDVIGGFNQFLEDQQAIPGEARMTFAQFDNVYEVAYQAKPLAEAPKLSRATYLPRGGTSLLDAIGRTLNEQGKRIADEGWADKVIVCIITDGEENSSREFTQSTIKTMVEHAEKNGWSFIFLAANQDAFTVGAAYGISAATTQNFTASGVGTRMAYANISGMTTALRTSGDTQ